MFHRPAVTPSSSDLLNHLLLDLLLGDTILARWSSMVIFYITVTPSSWWSSARDSSSCDTVLDDTILGDLLYHILEYHPSWWSPWWFHDHFMMILLDILMGDRHHTLWSSSYVIFCYTVLSWVVATTVTCVLRWLYTKNAPILGLSMSFSGRSPGSLASTDAHTHSTPPFCCMFNLTTLVFYSLHLWCIGCITISL